MDNFILQALALSSQAAPEAFFLCVHGQGSDLACDCFIFTFISGHYKLGEKCKTNLVSAKALLKPDNNNGASEESPISRKHYSKVKTLRAALTLYI